MKMKLIARVAAHVDAIEAARGAGSGWDEIAARLGAKNSEVARKTYANAKALIEAGKLKPIEQRPLPEPPAQAQQAPKETKQDTQEAKDPTPQATQPERVKPGEPIPRASGRQFFNSLPQIGGK